MTNTTTVEKVRIPAEVAEAIEFYRSEEGGPPYSNKKLIELVTRINGLGELALVMKQYAGENFDTFVKALYNGYTVEKPPKKITLELTPEELGTIVASLDVVNDDDARDSARETNYEFSDNPLEVWQKLRDIYEQEARA
jgi:hypothetical protein